MVKRFIGVVPSAVNTDAVASLRRQFDPLAATIAPHITLVFPFEGQATDQEIRRHVHVAVRGLSPFPLVLSGITGSEGTYLFLNVKRGNDSLIDLHDRLYSGRLQPYLSSEHTFIPHVTVGRVSSAERFREALGVASAIDIHIEATVNAVSVYR